jgi:hypothetical protein
MKEFYWNKETIDHFKFASNYTHISYVQQMVQEFVEIDCVLEDGETVEDLVTDLMRQIYE